MNTTNPRQGWRHFECECGHAWREASRDARSPSLEDCPECSAECNPKRREIDADLPVTPSGNLVKHQRQTL